MGLCDSGRNREHCRFCCGGLLIGVAENLTSGFLSPGYKDIVSFAIMILVLLIRPTGFMGYRFEEKV